MCEELQHLLEVVVDNKIRLYEEGIEVKTPRYPNGMSPFVPLTPVPVVRSSDANHVQDVTFECIVSRTGAITPLYAEYSALQTTLT